MDPDELLVTEFHLLNQKCTSISVAFEDEAVADYFEKMVDAGRKPEQFARIWLHTHPGDSPMPSTTDEATFARVFGSCDWAIMFILSRTGKTYARLRFRAGPGGQLLVPVGVRWDLPIGEIDDDVWGDEYADTVEDLDLFKSDRLEWWDEPTVKDASRSESQLEQIDDLDAAFEEWYGRYEEEVADGCSL